MRGKMAVSRGRSPGIPSAPMTQSVASNKTTADVQKVLGSGKPTAWRRIVTLIVAVALVGAGGTAGVMAWRARQAAKTPSYETAEARRSDVQMTVTATGTLQAVTTVEVGAEVSGKVLSVKVDVNDVVKKGQLLAQLDPEQLRASAEQAQAQVAQADASILQARATVNESTLALARGGALHIEGLLGEGDLEGLRATKMRADANLASAVASATLARAASKSARTHLDKATIFSPIDGSVLSRLIEPGQTVTAGFATPVLFKLAQNLTLMRLNADVDEADVGRVRDGLPATFTVEAFPHRQFESAVLSLQNEPKTSQNVVTYQAVLKVDNHELLLRPGMTCTATIIAETRRDVLTVPNAALRFTPPSVLAANAKKAGSVETDARQHVWVLVGGTPGAVEVDVGASDGVSTEILRGEIQVGTKVLVDVKESR